MQNRKFTASFIHLLIGPAVNCIRQTNACSFEYLKNHKVVKAKKQEVRKKFKEDDLPDVEGYLKRQFDKAFSSTKFMLDVEFELRQAVFPVSWKLFDKEELQKMLDSNDFYRSVAEFNGKGGFAVAPYLEKKPLYARLKFLSSKGSSIDARVERLRAGRMQKENEDKLKALLKKLGVAEIEEENKVVHFRPRLVRLG